MIKKLVNKKMMVKKEKKMAMLETVRNASIGIAVMILLPTITYVGTRLLIKEPSYPSHVGQDSEKYYKSEEYKIKMADYQNRKENFSKYYFYVSSVVGLLTIIAGAFVVPIPFLGMGFILGGTFCLMSGYFWYWDELDDIFKFISLIIALLILIISSFKLIKTKRK